MTLGRPLRGACECGRNRYVIRAPSGTADLAQVIFNTDAIHQSHLGPLASFIRVPLEWFSSSTFAYCDDETHAKIRRAYTNPSQAHTKRYFCGYCGTPISYWTEEPRSEAEYISLTLGSLLREDLLMLDELGLISENGRENTTGPTLVSHDDKQESAPESATEKPSTSAGEQAGVPQELAPVPEPVHQPYQAEVATSADKSASPVQLSESFGIPWFDSLITDSGLARTGNVRHAAGSAQSHDGRVRHEWAVYEWTADDNETQSSTLKRKHDGDHEHKVAVRKADGEARPGSGSMDQSEG